MLAAAHPAQAITGQVLLALAVIVTAAVLGARLAAKARQPAVVGEIVAVIALGPSLLGLLPGQLTDHLIPEATRPHLQVLAQLGLALFMFGVGYHLDFSHLQGAGRLVTSVSLASVAVPFGLGVGLAAVLFPWMNHTQIATDGRLGPTLFLGAAMSITAFPVLARILYDKGLHHDRIGALALASAALQDVLAWCLLAAITVSVHTGSLWTLARMLTALTVFVLALAYLVRPALARLLAPGRLWLTQPPGPVTLLIAGTLLCAWLSDSIGLHPVFGAFAFGATVPRKQLAVTAPEAARQIEQISLVLLPVFFTVTGLSVRFDELGSRGLVMVGAVLIAACVGKFAGGAGAARLAGAPARQALTLGVLLNARGLTELIILDVGLNLRLIDTQTFTAMVLMALVTTLMTGPLLDRLHPARPRDAAHFASRSNPETAEAETATSPSGVGMSTPRE
ncbi:cation:proton antiporter [Streptomyces mirabilis]|uniref:cation:proton antiporter n=1 Tax=Streptomyces mirabilis TaxID=68239 RepID=UPI0036A704B9